MKLRLLTIGVMTLSICAVLAEDKPAAPANPAFKDAKAKFSYALGMYYGNGFNHQDIQVDLDLLMQGMRDTVSSNKTLLTEVEMRQALTDEQHLLVAKREEKRKQQAVENKAKAEKFLAENKTKPGVVTTASGLQYKILTPGSGNPPGSNDTVTVDYRGSFLDGTEFDSSYKRGKPATFSINGVISGWKEALHLMPPGAKWELFIPPNLAYGEMGRPNIPPNSVLIFEVELHSNTPPATVQTQPLTSDIIKVPSMEEMKKGAKIETIKPDEVEKELKKQQQSPPPPPSGK